MSRVRVLIGGNDDWHDIITGGQRLRDLLCADGHAATLHLGIGEQQLGGPETRALVAHTNGARMTPAEQQAVADRVAAGTGFVALHQSTVDIGGPGEYDRWLGLIGSRFVSHPPFGRFTVSCDPGHPVTAGVGEFEIDDELYVTEPVGDPVTVIGMAAHEGTTRPMVTVRDHGKGRVVFIALGHDGRAQAHPAFQRLVRQAVRWAVAERG